MTRGARGGGPGDFDRIRAGISGINREPFNDDVFLAGSGKVQDALGTAAGRPKNNGFTRVRGYRDRRGPGSSAGNGIDKLFGVRPGPDVKRVTGFEKTYTVVDGGERLGKSSEILIRT